MAGVDRNLSFRKNNFTNVITFMEAGAVKWKIGANTEPWVTLRDSGMRMQAPSSLYLSLLLLLLLLLLFQHQWYLLIVCLNE